MNGLWIHFSLFVDAFIAATLLPAFSEIALAVLIRENIANPYLLTVSATTGNVLGSLVNWWLGKMSLQKSAWGKRLTSKSSFQRAETLFSRYGTWSLLFAWLPVFGDPLTLVAGALDTPLRRFIILVTIGKSARYCAILLATVYFSA